MVIFYYSGDATLSRIISINSSALSKTYTASKEYNCSDCLSLPRKEMRQHLIGIVPRIMRKAPDIPVAADGSNAPFDLPENKSASLPSRPSISPNSNLPTDGNNRALGYSTVAFGQSWRF